MFLLFFKFLIYCYTLLVKINVSITKKPLFDLKYSSEFPKKRI